MSRPEFERVLSAHREDALTCYDHPPTVDHPYWCCVCGEHLLLVSQRAHLAAALNAEVDRWLADEGTREVVARAIADRWAHPEYLHPELVRDAEAALAALTTPTDDDRTTTPTPGATDE